MSDARAAILGRIRDALGRGALDAEPDAELERRLAAPAPNLIPRRAAALDARGRIELFVDMAQEAQVTVERVPSAESVPAAAAAWLAGENLPAQLVVAPDPALDGLPWHERPLLQIRRGRAEDADPTSLTACFAGIAETGTLMLVSGPESPTTLNFLPDNHIVVLRESQVLATYEEGWARLRQSGAMPRTVNFITGPSRTGDIEQKIQLGAHGPRRLHVILVEDGPPAAAPDAHGDGD